MVKKNEKLYNIELSGQKCIQIETRVEVEIKGQ